MCLSYPIQVPLVMENNLSSWRIQSHIQYAFEHLINSRLSLNVLSPSMSFNDQMKKKINPSSCELNHKVFLYSLP